MLQRRAARWIKNSYSSYDSVSNMLEDLGWRSLENRHIDSQLVMFYKIIYGYVAVQIPPYFEMRNPSDTPVTCTLSGLGRSILLQHITSSLFIQQQLFFGTGSRQLLFWGLILTPSKTESVRSIRSP